MMAYKIFFLQVTEDPTQTGLNNKWYILSDGIE